jgi:hypothetical protein
MKHALRSQQHHDLYTKYHHQDSEISALPGECGYLLVAHKINAGIDNLDEFVDRWLAERFALCFSKDAKIGRQDTTGRDGHFMAFQCNPNMLESG